MPGTRLGPYEIAAQIGKGGMGEVFRAFDTNLGRQVAIKILPDTFAHDPERLARFEREAKTLAALNHPNIAQIHGFERAAGGAALVMELVEGPTLADRIGRGAIPLDEALPIARQVAEALESAHEQGIIHRDLKPANIKVRHDGTAKVLDFGLAKALGPISGVDADATSSPTITNPPMTRMGVVLGTTAYMAPEQARGGPVDRRSDVWSFGCVLFEMLAGRRAFGGETVSDTLAAVLRGEPDWSLLPRDLTPRIVTLLNRCLAKDRKHRLADLHDAALEIADASSSPDEMWPVQRRASRHQPLLLGSAMVAGLVAGAALTQLLDGRATVPQPVRFTITVPSDYALAPAGAGFAMVFDTNGRHLYFSAIKPDTPGEILKASLDSFEIQSVPGSRGYLMPSLSADGRWLFVRPSGGGRSVRLPIGGGKPAEIPGALGLVVEGADGRLYFSTGGVINTIDAGGSPIVIGDRSLGLTQPAPSTSGWLLATNSVKEEIVALNPSAGTVVTLERGRSPSLVADQYLVFFREGSLWAARVRPPNQILSEPVSMVSGVSLSQSPFGTAEYTTRAGHLAFIPAAPPPSRRLVWISRNGAPTGAFPEPSDYSSVHLSADGSRAVVMERAGLTVLDLQRGTRLRAATAGAGAGRPIWNPGGRAMTYRLGAQVFRLAADGSGAPELITQGERGQFPDDWSPDGRTLLVNEGAAHRDIIAVTDGHRQPIVATSANERGSTFHPSGRWFAYMSDESGRDEVYIQRWPLAPGKLPVSTHGGQAPRWAADGRNLLYRDGSRMMAVRFDAVTGLLSEPALVFEDSRLVSNVNIPSYDVAPDGRFLMIAEDTANRAGEIRVILNWVEELKRRLPN